MDSMSLNEMIVTALFGQDGVDVTNAAQLFRTAQQNVVGFLCAEGVDVDEIEMDHEMDIDYIDGLMITLTENGSKSLFE